MTPKELPPHTYAAARRVWIDPPGSNDDYNAIVSWAAKRWPGVALPKNPETMALWVLSIAIQDGTVPA